METEFVELESVIKDIAAGPFGSNLKVDCFVPEGFPIIDGANLKGIKVTDNITKFVTEEKARSLHRPIAKRGDVVVTISGTVGQISYIPDNSVYEEYLVSQRQFRVTFDTERVHVPYIVYYFHTYEGQSKILSFANQTGVPALAQPLKNFKKIKIKLPSKEQQKKISLIAELITSKIECNQEISNNLEQQAQALYQHMFIDSPCAEWREGSLSDIAEVSSGKRPPMKSTVRTNETAFPIVGAADVMGFTDSFNHNDKILIIGRVGTHGVVQRFNSPCWTSDNTLVITSDYYEHVYQILKRIDYHSLNRGSTQPLITQSDINKVPVLLPDNDALIKYETLAGTLMSEHEANVIENTKLSEIRDTLLPRLMSGEIDVSDIDI